MNTKHWWIAMAWVAGLTLSCTLGCHSRQSVDIARVEQSFQNAPDTERTEIDQALAAIKAGDHAAALESLNKVTQSARLTPAQLETLRDLIVQLQQTAEKTAAGAAKTVSESGSKADEAARDLQKTLPK